ncbi:NPHP3 [Symbiodinium sp. CCMP2592]|nr:NPHP3 [Symbiodinium sp. CCMP2592]
MASPSLKCQEHKSGEESIHRASGSASPATETPRTDSYLLCVEDVTVDVQSWLRQALWLRRQVLADAQPELRGSIDCRLAEVQWQQRGLGQAAVDMLQAIPRDGSMQHAPQIVLAQILLSQAKVDEAEKLLQEVSQAVGARVSLQGRSATSEQVAPAAALCGRQRQLQIRVQLILAQLQAAAGRKKLSAELLRALLADAADFSEYHPDILQARRTLAGVLTGLGDFPEAEQQQRKVLERGRHLLGDMHPYTLEAMRDLAITLQEQHEFGEAEMLLDHALAIYRALFELTHEACLSCAVDLANLLASPCVPSTCQKVDRAEMLLYHAACTAEWHLGAAFPERTFWHCFNLVLFLERKGELEEADERCCKLLAVVEAYCQTFDESCDQVGLFRLTKKRITRSLHRRSRKGRAAFGIYLPTARDALMSLAGFVVLMDLLFFWLACALKVFPTRESDTDGSMATLLTNLLLEPLATMILCFSTGLVILLSFMLALSSVTEHPNLHRLPGRWGFIYRSEQTTLGRSWHWLQSGAGCFVVLRAAAFIVGAAQNDGEVPFDWAAWGMLASWSGWEIFWTFFQTMLSWNRHQSEALRTVLICFTFGFVRVTSLYLCVEYMMHARSWAEIWWPCVWLLFFVSSPLIRVAGEHLQPMVRRLLESMDRNSRKTLATPARRLVPESCGAEGEAVPGPAAKLKFCDECEEIFRLSSSSTSRRGGDSTLHAPSSVNATKSASERIKVASGLGRASQQVGAMLSQRVAACWCLVFLALVAVEGDCYGDYAVSGAVGSGRFCNGGYRYGGQKNGRPFYGKTSGQGSMFMNAEHHWVLHPWKLTATESADQYQGPAPSQPPEAAWADPNCDCSEPAPRVSACTSGCDFVVTGAGGLGQSCNGNYTYEGELNGMPSYRHADGGALLFHRFYWKLTTAAVMEAADSEFAVNWIYNPGLSQELPTGRWVIDGDYERRNMDPAPTVTACQGCDVDYIVTGAGGLGATCNGNYSLCLDCRWPYAQLDQTIYRYRKGAGEAWIFMSTARTWRMSCRNSTSVWHYSEPLAQARLPPTGQWVASSRCRCSYSGLAVSQCNQCDTAAAYTVAQADGPHSHANGEYFSTIQDGKQVYEKAGQDARIFLSSENRWVLRVDDNSGLGYGQYFAPGQEAPPLGSWQWQGSFDTAAHHVTVSTCNQGVSLVVLPLVALLLVALLLHAGMRIREILRSEVKWGDV